MLISPIRKSLLGRGSARRPRIVAVYNVLSSGNYTEGTGGLATLANLGPYAAISLAQANTALRPGVNATGINGGPAMEFTAANNDSLTMVGGRAAFCGTDGVWCYVVGQFASAPAMQNLFATLFNSAGSGLATFAMLSSAKLRGAFRRLASDAARVVDSTLTVPIGVPTGAGIAGDTRRMRVLFASNEDYEYLATGAFTSGYGSMERAPATADHLIGRSGTSTLDGFIGTIYLGTGVATPEFFEGLRLANRPIFNTPQRSLSVDAKPVTLQNKIYRSYGGVATVSLSGKVVIGGDADIYARFLDFVTGTAATGWETPQLLTSSSGLAWSASPSVPDGDWFLEVRKLGERDADAVLDRTNIIGISDDITKTAGQSLMRDWATWAGSPYPQSVFPAAGDDLRGRRFSRDGYGYYHLSQTTNATANVPVGTGEPIDLNMQATNFNSGGGTGGGNGGKKYGVVRWASTGKSALVIPMAIGGTTLAACLSGGGNYTHEAAQLASADSPGRSYKRIVLGTGYSDILTGTSYAAYSAQLAQYHIEQRALADDGNDLYSYIAPASWIVGGSPTLANARAIYQATWDFIDAYDDGLSDRNFLGWTDHDLPRSADNLHPNPAVNQHTACRFAQNVAFREEGGSHGARGPKLTSVVGVAGTSYIEGTFTLDGGTTLKGLIFNPSDPYALTPSFQNSGLTGTLAMVNGAAVATTDVAITAATKVRWYLPAPLVSGDTFDIGLFTEPDFSRAVMLMDDSNPQGDTIGVPAQPTRLWVSATVA